MTVYQTIAIVIKYRLILSVSILVSYNNFLIISSFNAE